VGRVILPAAAFQAAFSGPEWRSPQEPRHHPSRPLAWNARQARSRGTGHRAAPRGSPGPGARRTAAGVAEAGPELGHASARCLVAIHCLGRFRQLVKCARISVAVSRLPQPQPQGFVTTRGRQAPGRRFLVGLIVVSSMYSLSGSESALVGWGTLIC